MDKYIVEIDGKNICSDSDGKSKLALSVKADNGYAVFCTEIPLTPYTAPDLEQVRKEAYENGYKTAKVQCNIQAEKDLREVGERHYQKGLSDAWDTVRKIRGMTWNEQREVFGTDYFTNIIALPASECIEKIRQYEQEKDRQARIEYNFDEIKDVLETTAKECNVSLDEIAEVLRKMKEADNG